MIGLIEQGPTHAVVESTLPLVAMFANCVPAHHGSRGRIVLEIGESYVYFPEGKWRDCIAWGPPREPGEPNLYLLQL